MTCASGMAAISAALLSRLDGGGHVALSAGLYGKTVALVTRELSRFGVHHTLFDAARVEALRAALTPETRVVFAETLSNPLLRMAGRPCGPGTRRPRCRRSTGHRPYLRPLALPADRPGGRPGRPLRHQTDRRPQRSDPRPARRNYRLDRPRLGPGVHFRPDRQPV